MTPPQLHSSLRAFFFTAALSGLAFSTSAQPAAPEEVGVFTGGEDGYSCFRIPATVVAKDGSVLAFCEGRKHSCHDSGDIDLVLRRSADGGKSWGPLQVVWDDEANTCGNPAPVVDLDTGRVWLFTTWNRGTDHETQIHDGVSSDTRRVFLTYSDDHGQTWAPPQEMTSTTKQADWRWYATGPGHAIQHSSGRFIIPANHSEPRSRRKAVSYSHVIVSDDGGKTWRLGATVGPRTNESSVAELADGRLCINMRSYHETNTRSVAFSDTRGDSWSEIRQDETLIEPVCQASLLRHTDAQGRVIHLFSNPASTKRERMTVRISDDSCQSWSSSRVLYDDFSAYSDLCSLTSDTVGCLYERRHEGKNYGRIAFARIALDWLRDAPASDSLAWGTLPPLPDPHGVAGPFAGVCRGDLIVAGGANFPNGKPWEGGSKVWHDTVYVMKEGTTSWTVAGRLPRSLAYGVSITTKEGLLCIGGDDADRAYADTFLLQWDGSKLKFTDYPPLPSPTSGAAGVLVDNIVYLAGGTDRPGATAASTQFLALDLNKKDDGWKPLETWPGPGRMLATAGTIGKDIYLMSGAALSAGPDGKPLRKYLTDAYRYTPGQGWKAIADLPRPAVAAPSPALSLKQDSLCLLGGDDGKLAGRPAAPDHPGFPRTILNYQAATNAWAEAAGLAESPVTTPLIPWKDQFVIPSGEIRPGVRTPSLITVKSPMDRIR